MYIIYIIYNIYIYMYTVYITLYNPAEFDFGNLIKIY